MDENEFMKAFLGIDQLAVEGVAKLVGAIIAKLREGMIEGGMEDYAADALIMSTLRIFLDYMAKLGGAG